MAQKVTLPQHSIAKYNTTAIEGSLKSIHSRRNYMVSPVLKEYSGPCPEVIPEQQRSR